MISMAVMTSFFDIVAGVSILVGNSSLLDTPVIKLKNNSLTVRHVLGLGFAGIGLANLWSFEKSKKTLAEAESLNAESPSYMVASDADKLLTAARKIEVGADEDQPYPEWWKSQLSVATDKVDGLADFLSYAEKQGFASELSYSDETVVVDDNTGFTCAFELEEMSDDGQLELAICGQPLDLVFNIGTEESFYSYECKDCREGFQAIHTVCTRDGEVISEDWSAGDNFYGWN